jgi:hypothetical protein
MQRRKFKNVSFPFNSPSDVLADDSAAVSCYEFKKGEMS